MGIERLRLLDPRELRVSDLGSENEIKPKFQPVIELTNEDWQKVVDSIPTFLKAFGQWEHEGIKALALAPLLSGDSRDCSRLVSDESLYKLFEKFDEHPYRIHGLKALAAVTMYNPNLEHDKVPEDYAWKVYSLMSGGQYGEALGPALVSMYLIWGKGATELALAEEKREDDFKWKDSRDPKAAMERNILWFLEKSEAPPPEGDRSGLIEALADTRLVCPELYEKYKNLITVSDMDDLYQSIGASRDVSQFTYANTGVATISRALTYSILVADKAYIANGQIVLENASQDISPALPSRLKFES